MISDAHSGLAAAAGRWFQSAARQRCRAHFIGHLLAAVPKHLLASGRRGFHKPFPPSPMPKPLTAHWPKPETNSPPASQRPAR
ncbi:MAG: transposase [Acidimicrobiia bacterium]|nr:transposase [Acidimicrobiia bacterium]